MNREQRINTLLEEINTILRLLDINIKLYESNESFPKDKINFKKNVEYKNIHEVTTCKLKLFLDNFNKEYKDELLLSKRCEMKISCFNLSNELNGISDEELISLFSINSDDLKELDNEIKVKINNIKTLFDQLEKLFYDNYYIDDAKVIFPFLIKLVKKVANKDLLYKYRYIKEEYKNRCLYSPVHILTENSLYNDFLFKLRFNVHVINNEELIFKKVSLEKDLLIQKQEPDKIIIRLLYKGININFLSRNHDVYRVTKKFLQKVVEHKIQNDIKFIDIEACECIYENCLQSETEYQKKRKSIK